MAPFLAGADGKCPNCGGHRFSGPAELRMDEKVTCLTCGHVPTVEEALDAGSAKPKAGGSENLVDK